MMDQAQSSTAPRRISAEDGRGLFPDRIQTAAPIGLRDDVRRAASLHGMTSAAFIREAIQERLRQASVSRES